MPESWTGVNITLTASLSLDDYLVFILPAYSLGLLAGCLILFSGDKRKTYLINIWVQLLIQKCPNNDQWSFIVYILFTNCQLPELNECEYILPKKL